MPQSVSVIIPAHNEALTIASVIDAAKASLLVSEVVVVSDGSTDKTVEIAMSRGARVIELEHNQGKGKAMRIGSQATRADILVFLDADLKGLTRTHVDQLVKPVLNDVCGMNVGLRDRGAITWVQHHLPLISGERALKRVIFDRINPRFFHRFMTEPAINYSCRIQGFVVQMIEMKGVTIRRKYEKVGFLKAVVQYLRMTYSITSALILVRVSHLFGMFLM